MMKLYNKSNLICGGKDSFYKYYNIKKFDRICFKSNIHTQPSFTIFRFRRPEPQK